MRIFGKKLNRNSILYWILPYVVCIVVSVALSSVSYFQAMQVISEQARQAHEESVVAISDKIEPMLSKTSFAMMQVIASKNVEIACEEKNLSPGEDYFVFGQIQTELAEAGNLSDIIHGEYVYFPRTGYLLSENNFYSGDGIDRVFKRDMGLSETDKEQLLNSRNALDYRLFPSGEGTRAFLTHAIPIHGRYEDGAVIVFELDTSVFLDSLSIHSQESGRFAAIIDGNNTMLLAGSWPDRRIEYQNSDGSVVSTEYGKGAGRIVASGIASEASNWEYVTGIPYKVLMSRMNHILTFIFSFMLIGVFAGLALAYYFARRSYSSIDQLMRKFMESLSVSRQDGVSFESLEKILESMISERRQLDKSFERYRDAARENVIVRLLGGSPFGATEIRKTMRELGIDLNSGHFILLILSVDDFSHIFFDEKADEDDRIFALVNLILSNIVGELAGKEFPAYMAELMGYNACLIHIDRPAEDVERTIRQIAENAIDFIRSNFGIKLSAMVSREIFGLEHIHPAFTEAIGQFDLFDHEPTVYLLSELHHTASQEKERSAAREIREQVYQNVIREIGEMEIRDPSVFEQLRTAIGNARQDDAEETEDSDAASRWAGEICDYIDLNYTDPALNISFIAYRFNMNPAYIGRRFKEVMGTGLLEYIHRKRMEEAEKLLESGMKTKDAAERVGFSNALTMRRVFERYKAEKAEKRKTG